MDPNLTMEENFALWDALDSQYLRTRRSVMQALQELHAQYKELQTHCTAADSQSPEIDAHLASYFVRQLIRFVLCTAADSQSPEIAKP